MTSKKENLSLPRYNPNYWNRCWVLKKFTDRTCLTCPMPECWYGERYEKRWETWDMIEQIGGSELSTHEAVQKFSKELDVHPRVIYRYQEIYWKNEGNRIKFVSGDSSTE